MVKCSLCRRNEAFYFRRYSGEYLCRKCFAESIENKVRVTIGKHKMFETNDRIAVAVSGGKDSVSLLHILSKIEKEFPKSSLCAITVDEGIKGYRDEAIRIAAQNCAQLGIEQTTVSFKELYGFTMDEIARKTREDKLTPCAYCGVLRRRALNIAARKVGADKIATAHTLDDEIQTFLLNIIHGDPLRIARSGPVYKLKHHELVPRTKPFCEVLERESTLYAFVKGISFQEMPCPYAGEALRNDVRNTLNRLEEKHPGIKYTIYGSMNKIRQAMEKSVQKTPLERCEECGEPTAGKICQVCLMLRKLRSL
ncbi:TIGR00269 family protein [Candidatus Bathyarchaeota archaeon]|nr:MAG: TIGR00269 family protein [Candidatus Bathyarchaeota archaeon]